MFNVKTRTYTRLATLLLLSSVAVSSLASQPSGNTLTVNFTGIEEGPGTIYMVVFDSEDAYANQGEPAFTRAIPVTDQDVSVTIPEVKNGTYAIKSFLDSNDNQQMDTNMVGLPKEQYGFSNNAGRFGPASFDEAAFTVEGDNSISIKLR